MGLAPSHSLYTPRETKKQGGGGVQLDLPAQGQQTRVSAAAACETTFILRMYVQQAVDPEDEQEVH